MAAEAEGMVAEGMVAEVTVAEGMVAEVMEAEVTVAEVREAEVTQVEGGGGRGYGGGGYGGGVGIYLGGASGFYGYGGGLYGNGYYPSYGSPRYGTVVPRTTYYVTPNANYYSTPAPATTSAQPSPLAPSTGSSSRQKAKRAFPPPVETSFPAWFCPMAPRYCRWNRYSARSDGPSARRGISLAV